MTTDLLTKARDPLIGQRIDGRYLVQRVIGRGGMGVVYEGLHEQLERPVAIKVLGAGISGDPIAVKRFLREAQTASQLTHGNIVDVSDLGVLEDGRPYLVMPKVQGIDLGALLVQNGPQTPRRTAELLFGAAAALDLIHAKGFVHRDVKPENLMHVVREDGSETTLLLDFGIVGLVSAPTMRLTADGAVFGTPAYLAPEVIEGAPPDRAADVYALATVAFELMSGRVPFDAENPLKILPQKVMLDAPRMSALSGVDFPESIEAVVARGLTRDPADRWPSASELVAALDAAVLDLELASGEFEPTSRSAALRRSAVAAGRKTPQSQARRAAASEAASPPMAAKHAEELRADTEQLEELAPYLADLSPLPPLETDADASATSKLERGSETLSVEFRAAKLGVPGRERKARLWVGIGAGALIGALVLVLKVILQDPGPVPAAAPPGELEPIVRPRPSSPPITREPEPSLPTGVAPTEAEAASEPIPPPTAASVKQPGRKAGGKRAQPDETARPRGEFDRSLPKPEARPATAPVTKAPAAPMSSANELVKAAARELIQGHLSAAADLYVQATRLDPKSEPAYRGLGLTNERLGNKADAIRAFNRAIALAPNGQSAEMLRARIVKLQGRP